MASTINKATNANLYIDGGSTLGMVAEFTVPTPTQKVSENMPLGQIGTTQHFAGFEPMEASIKWASIYEEFFRVITDPFRSHALQLRASVDVYDSNGLASQVPFVVFLTARFKSIPGGVFKAHENVELDSDIIVDSIKTVYNGTVLLDFDAAANRYFANGVDVLATYRNNLGI